MADTLRCSNFTPMKKNNIKVKKFSVSMSEEVEKVLKMLCEKERRKKSQMIAVAILRYAEKY